MSSSKTFQELKRISGTLSAGCGALRFSSAGKGSAAAVYNPLDYAAAPHEAYLKLCGGAPKKIMFLGMNPGPWGMAQTGVPFGEVAAVRDWLGIEGKVERPQKEHPKRPIQGFACPRSEVSGRRLWALFRETFGSPQVFFRDHYVANYCPLVFMDAGGANLTPDKLKKEEGAPLFELCDQALAQTIKLLKPQWLIGVGGFAYKKILHLTKEHFGGEGSFRAAQILHPSPASPRANAGWAQEVTKTLHDLGAWE